MDKESMLEIWDNMRNATPSLDKSKQKILTKWFPLNEFKCDFKAPILYISSNPMQLDFQFEEGFAIAQGAIFETLHKSYVHVGNHPFIITTIKTNSFYGRSTDISKDAGIVVIKLPKLFLVVVHCKPHATPTIISNAEGLAQELMLDFETIN